MSKDCLQIALNSLAAGAAFVAAISWYQAARHPVALLIPAHYDITHMDLEPANEQIRRGAKLNGRAASWAAVSAIFQVLALLVPFISRIC